MKIYTRNGDTGTTTSFSGETFRKNDTIIECLGCADEAITSIEKSRLRIIESISINNNNYLKDIDKITDALYQLMAELSNGKASGLSKTIQQGYIDRLERRIDEMNIKPTGFIYFTNLISLELSESRVRVRRLERRLTNLLRHEVIRTVLYKYINRLSDYLFVLAVKIEDKN